MKERQRKTIALFILSCGTTSVISFLQPTCPFLVRTVPRKTTSSSLCSSTNDKKDSSKSSFSAFVEPIDEDSIYDNNNNKNEKGMKESTTWQESLDILLDMNTPMLKRQLMLSDLLNAGDDVRESVLAALRERKIDPLLTPTGKKLQDGTRAVARQITTDILPNIAEVPKNNIPSNNKSTSNNYKNKANNNNTTNKRRTPEIAEELPTLLPKITSRIFDAVSNQAKQNLELLRADLADPSRIPLRLTKQVNELTTEAKNVFLETPEGLVGPEYDVVETGEGYEIREYGSYSVASTSMSKVGEPYSNDDVATGGAAFNALAAYLFGANEEGRVMEMTTPVATTSLGEMRFFLRCTEESSQFPKPLEQEEDKRFNQVGAVKIVDVPPARLAVARFTGFVTEGEVARQKDALLNALDRDEVEVDVPHGAVVPHVVFQYNPPYTIPIVRRNEIAVPVRRVERGVVSSGLESEWVGDAHDDGDDLAPSDVDVE